MPKQIKQVTEQTLTLSSIGNLLDQKLDQRFGEFETKLDKKFEKIDQRFEKIEGTLDRTINIVIDLKQDMEIVKDFLATEVMTKTDGREIITTVDVMVTYQKKFDQELTLQGHKIANLAKTSDRHTKEIKALQLTVT